VNRPLKRAPREKKPTLPKDAGFPGLEGIYTHRRDGSILVHEGTYTDKRGRVITLTESTIVREGSTVSISGGSQVY
jgi:hypothetical protein